MSWSCSERCPSASLTASSEAIASTIRSALIPTMASAIRQCTGSPSVTVGAILDPVGQHRSRRTTCGILGTLLAVMAASCASPGAGMSHRAAKHSTTTTSDTSAENGFAVKTPCPGFAGPGPVPPSPQIEPLLLTSSDVPAGYETHGPQLTPPSGTPEFFDTVPANDPTAYVAFSLNSNPGPGGVPQSQDGIIEAVGKATSPEDASSLLQQVYASATIGGAGETPSRSRCRRHTSSLWSRTGAPVRKRLRAPRSLPSRAVMSLRRGGSTPISRTHLRRSNRVKPRCHPPWLLARWSRRHLITSLSESPTRRRNDVKTLSQSLQI